MRRLHLRGGGPHEIITTVTKNEFRGLLPAIVVGLLFSFVPALAASYAVSYVAENFWQAYVLGFIPSAIGLSIIAMQVVLVHEGIHHTVFKPTEWLPEARIGLAGFGAVLITYPLLFFIPVDNPALIWQHPAISVHDAALMVFLAVAAPYVTKVLHDILLLDLSSVSTLWRISLAALLLYFISSTAVVLLLIPDQITLGSVLQRTTVTTISFAGVFYTLRGQLIDRHDEQEYIQSRKNEDENPILFKIRDSRKVTFLAAVVAGTGLPIAAGASVGSSISGEASTHFISPGIFILFGYPKLFLYSWLFAFGPIVIAGTISGLIIAVSVTNQMFVSD